MFRVQVSFVQKTCWDKVDEKSKCGHLRNDEDQFCKELSSFFYEDYPITSSRETLYWVDLFIYSFFNIRVDSVPISDPNRETD